MKFLTIPVTLTLALILAACSKSEAPQASAPKTVAAPDFAAECSNTAATWFKGAYGEGSKTLEDGRVIKASYQSHYSTQRKQCLVRLTSDTAAKDKRAAIANVSVWAMGDKPSVIAAVVHVRNKLTYCVAEGKRCKNIQEWEVAVAPLMKE